MDLKISPEAAATAARQILGFYPTIPASDPKGFAAGLVKTLSIFPAEVIARAVDPVEGLPGKIKFLNLADIRECLDGWLEDHLNALHRRAVAERPRVLPEPPRDPVVDARIEKGLRELVAHLTSGFGPGEQSFAGRPVL